MKPRLRNRARAERSGRLAETAAVLLLRLKGYRILARRYRSPVGEIDIVAERPRFSFRGNTQCATIVFIEVKKRAELEDALFSVHPRQQRRIERAAGAFLAANPSLNGAEMRFDVIVVGRFGRPRHVVNAWRPE